MPSSAAVTPSPDAGAFVAGPFRLHPFRALMLAPTRVGDPASARALARPYRDVSRRLRSWEAQGRVLRDATPALHLHEYTTDSVTVRGLVGALDLTRRASDPAAAIVLPHEAIHPAQAGELAARMSEMELNPAPILLVHRGPAAVREVVDQVAASEPDHAYTDRAQQQHRLWAIRDPAVVAMLDQALADARVLVADGHHRYAAYLRLQQERAGDPAGAAAGRGLAMLVDQDDTPLHLGAIHRVLPGVSFEDLVDTAPAVGRLVEASSTDALAALSPTTLVVTDGNRWARVTLDDDVASGQRAAVEVVHERLVPRLGGGPGLVGHHHSVESALAELGRVAGVAVLLPAPGYDLVRRVLAARRLLPEKATSFQPKPSLGALMRSLLDG